MFVRMAARCYTVVALLVVCGCTSRRPVEHSRQQLLEQFGEKLNDFVAAADAAGAPAPIEQDEIVTDLRHRVGVLEDVLGDLYHQTRDNTEKQAMLSSISQTLADVRRSTEGTPNFGKLRDDLRKLQGQLQEMQHKL